MQNKNIVFITKGEGALSTDEVIKIFESTDDLEVIKAAVEKANERLYASWASVDIKDKAGELIPIEDIANQQDKLMKRNGPISDEHTNRITGQTLAYKVLTHPDSNSLGVLHLNKIFDDGNKIDNQIWDEIKSGERKGSSVGGYNEDKSKGIDKVTGDSVDVLEGFAQMETASVFEPCNPLALNIAYAVVAKSNTSNAKKPEALDSCVAHLVADPEFKPEAGRTKEESAFAVCQAAIAKSDPNMAKNIQKAESVINKLSKEQDIIDKNQPGDLQMDNEKLEKSLSDITKGIEGLSGRLAKLEKQDEPPKDEDKPKDDKPNDDVPPEDKKKTDEGEKPKDEDTPKVEDKKKAEDKVNKDTAEDAAGDIDGEGDAEIPKEPRPEPSNEQEAFKKLEAKNAALEKKFEGLQKSFVAKTKTPAPGTLTEAQKKDPYMNSALDIALKGKICDKKANWATVHKTVADRRTVQAPIMPFGGL